MKSIKVNRDTLYTSVCRFLKSIWI